MYKRQDSIEKTILTNEILVSLSYGSDRSVAESLAAETVSYTHLDVYKRQRIDNLQVKFLISNAIDIDLNVFFYADNVAFNIFDCFLRSESKIILHPFFAITT